jgi:hypothetical protein
LIRLVEQTRRQRPIEPTECKSARRTSALVAQSIGMCPR